MTEQVKLERRKKITKIILITVTVLFIFVMLVVPLFSVMASALKEGLGFYLKAISTRYVLSALKVTLIATVFAVVINTFFGIWTAWLLTRFSFKGKQVLATLIDIPFSISPVIVGLAYLMTFGRLGWFYPVIRWFNEIFGTNVRITFAIPGVVLATIFVTFPYVSREIISFPKRRAPFSLFQCGRSRSADGSIRLYDISENNTSADEVEPDLWNHTLYGESPRRVRRGKCALEDKRRDIYTAA